MDPIKNLISAADPVHNDPSVPDGEAALRRMLSEPAAFSDTLPAGVTSLADRKLRRARLAGVLTLAAAAVTAGVLVATNLGALTAPPEPASTVSGLGTASATATPTAPPAPTSSATPPADPTPLAAATAPAAAAGPVACVKENAEAVQTWLTADLPSMQVSGCAGEWMALSTMAASGHTEVASFFRMARLRDRKYVIDADQTWAQVPGWDSAAANDERLTAEQYMDRQFTANGIPVELRRTLVGAPVAGSPAARGIKTYVHWSDGYKLAFTYPAAWQTADPSGGLWMANGPGISLTDSAGKHVAPGRGRHQRVDLLPERGAI